MSAIQQVLAAYGAAASGGGGTTWNSADKGASVTLTNSDLTASTSATGAVRATTSKASGKWQFEITAKQSGSWLIGIGDSTASISNYPGSGSTAYGYRADNGNRYNAASATAYGSTFTNADVIGVTVDFTTNTLVFYKNGVAQGNISVVARTYFPMVGANAATGVLCDLNAGQTAFAFPISGFLPWTP